MSLTTPKQVLHDIKVGYVNATGDTDTITYGNIASKCNSAYGGSGTGTIPFSNIFECIESSTLAGIYGTTAPTPDVQNNINMYWYDTLTSKWKHYDTDTSSWVEI